MSRKHPKTSSFGNLEACFFISLIVLLSDFLKGQLSLLCEGNSAESFTKRIGSEWPDKDKSNMNSIAWKIHFLYSEGPEIQALNPLDWVMSNDSPTPGSTPPSRKRMSLLAMWCGAQTVVAGSPGTGIAYFPPSSLPFDNCKDIKSLKAWHPTLCKSHPRRLCLVSHFFLHPGREIHTSSCVQSPSSEYQGVSSWSQCDPSPR